MLLSADDRLSRARIVLDHRGRAAEDLLPRVISESWSRCLAIGLDPKRPPSVPVLEAPGLQRAREQSALLRRLAVGEMENLYQQIAGTNFMVSLAAPDGMLLDALCDSSFGDAAGAASIRPGAVWSEARCGTNAIGTAAQTGQAVTVHGGEHFFSRYGGLTCTAVPILGADGRLAGVLDASSDCRSRQQHTHALVSMAAAQIENGLFRECHRGSIVIAFHSRVEFLHTLGAGLLAVDPDGQVLAVNARAGFLLQGLPAVRGASFEALFRTSLANLLDGGRDGDRQRLEDRVGSVFAARLETLPRPRVPLAARPAPSPAPAPSGFVAQDQAVIATLRLVEAAAARKLPILIRGATGTGKEHLARHAHQASGRRGPFVPVNCAGLPDTLAEAELFGHADGAFTGARRGGAPGLVAESDGGTLFLDEIGDMKLPLQSILLRLLDDWTLRPVGGGRRRQVDVLLVAATNVDLDAAVAAGRFRADLLHRINTVEVGLPPLRRRSDFGAVARRILAEVAPDACMSDEAVAALGSRPWPGNVRELRSMLIRLTLLDPARQISGDALCTGEMVPPVLPDAARPSLRTSQAQQVRQAHRDAGGNVTETARRLGVSRNTVYRALRGTAG
ncbi:MAG: sigma-54-dependent Fis family transcriptional regulator [Janthinobacterium lividum]